MLSTMARPWLVVMGASLLAALVVLLGVNGPMPLASMALFAVGVAGILVAFRLNGRRQAGGAILAVLVGAFSGLLGLSLWQLPWMVLHQVPLSAVYTNPSMSSALTLMVAVGVVIVGPSLIFLGTLVLRDATRVSQPPA